MKKHLPLILAFLIPLFNVIYAQSGCLPEGITFTSQAQIDNFPFNYPGCTVIEGTVEIRESISGEITRLDSLWPITIIKGNLAIEVNLALENLNGFENLTSLGGNLVIGANDALESLNGLNNLASISGGLDIYNNMVLGNFNGLGKIPSVKFLAVYGNEGLQNMNGLDSMAFIETDFWLMGNFNLSSLNGLEQLKSIGDRFWLVEHFNLSSLDGLAQLSSVGGFFVFGDIYPLPNLAGLNNLTSIGGEMNIFYCHALTSLDGLENLDYATIDSLYITGNPYLSVCDIRPVCDYLENGGYAEIFDNAPGCNTQQEVEAACAVSVAELLPAGAIRIFPNPATGIIRIEAPEDAEWEVSVLDAMGRILVAPRMLEKGQYDLSGLPAGVYFLELNDGQRSIAKRVIRQ